MGESDPHRLSVVGCGTAAPDGERACSGYWLADGETRVLFDCGPGVVYNLAHFGLPWPSLSHLVLSHFHNDHTGDVPMLLFALQYGTRVVRTDAFTVIGPAGTRARLSAMAAAFGDHLSDPTFPLEILEIAQGQTLRVGSIELSALHTPHTAVSLAYRARCSDFTFGFTGDTGPSDEVADFLQGVDELIAECAMSDAEAIDIHLSPRSLARLAQRADPRKLVVTHVYPQFDRQAIPRQLAAHGWSGACRVAADGMRLR